MILPAYASSLSFELFTEESIMISPNTGDLRVRFLYRNDTDASLTAYPLFDHTENSMPYINLTLEPVSRAVNRVTWWCFTS